ncbi:unnamed protein product [Caenorhabditis brenneri]
MLSSAMALYLDELLKEMNQLSESPIELKNTRILLSREISTVFEGLSRNESLQIESFLKENKRNDTYSPQNSRPSSFTPLYPPMDSPYSSSSFFNSTNPFVTPIKNGRMRSPEQDLGDWSRENPEVDPFVLQTKIYIPEPPNNNKLKYNYIGRILGPSGTSARMIESQYDVTLLIRGAGSMKDAETEETFRGKKRYEHLDEPLHVLLIARHNSRQRCEEILDRAAEKIESLLVPVHDDYKKEQLVRYAIMNGTYEHRSKEKTQSAGKKRHPIPNEHNVWTLH